MKLQDALRKLNTYNTKTLRKRVLTTAVVLAVVGGIGTGGAEYYDSQQKAALREAQTAMVKSQAEQQHLTLLSDNQVRTIAAKAMNADENSVTFKSVTLANANDQKDKQDKHDKKHPVPSQVTPQPAVAPTSTTPTTPNTAAATAQAITATTPTVAPAQPVVPHPVYTVRSTYNGMSYLIKMDAVTGTILQTKLGKASPFSFFD